MPEHNKEVEHKSDHEVKVRPGKTIDEFKGKIQERYSALEARLSEQDAAIKKLQRKVSRQHMQIQQLKTSQKQSQHQHEFAIGFSAYLVTSKVYGPGDKIEFARSEYNSGSYDNTTSDFYCPVSGVYYFTVNIYFGLDDDPYSGGASIVRAGQTVTSTRVYSAIDNSNIYMIATASALTSCQAGQDVFVRSTVTASISGSEDARYTTFTGFLLAQTA